MRKSKLPLCRLGRGGRWPCGGLTRATGRPKFKSSKTRNKKAAERAAAALEHDLREGKLATNARMAWQDFVVKFSEQVLPGRAEKTRLVFATVFNAIDRLVKPDRLGSLTATRLDEFAALLRKEGKAEATIKTYLAHLRGSLAWAAKLKWIRAIPEFPETLRAPKGDGGDEGAADHRGRVVEAAEGHQEGCRPKGGQTLAAAACRALVVRLAAR